MDDILRTAARKLASKLKEDDIVEEFSCDDKNYAVANEPHYWRNNRAYEVASVNDVIDGISYEPFVITMGNDNEAFFNKFDGEITYKWYITPGSKSGKSKSGGSIGKKYRF